MLKIGDKIEPITLEDHNGQEQTIGDGKKRLFSFFLKPILPGELKKSLGSSRT